jgi:hypothetical protein
MAGKATMIAARNAQIRSFLLQRFEIANHVVDLHGDAALGV